MMAYTVYVVGIPECPQTVAWEIAALAAPGNAMLLCTASKTVPADDTLFCDLFRKTPFTDPVRISRTRLAKESANADNFSKFITHEKLLLSEQKLLPQLIGP